jgi:hypothetical protein
LPAFTTGWPTYTKPSLLGLRSCLKSLSRKTLRLLFIHFRKLNQARCDKRVIGLLNKPTVLASPALIFFN